MYIYLNDRFVDSKDAVISVFDHGFMYGDGFFETLTSYDGKVFKAKEHIKRLFRSAEILAIPIHWSHEELIGLINEAVELNSLKNAYIRLSISRGNGAIGIKSSLCSKSTLVIYSYERTLPPDKLYLDGVSVSIVSVIRNSRQAIPPEVKSTNFLNNILAKMEAEKDSVYEGIMLNSDGHITEGTVSNVFFITKEKIYTPSLDVGILNGITRQIVIAIAGDVEEGNYLPKRLYQADEVFLTNSSMELVPVILVDGQTIGSGYPGPKTKNLIDAYKTYVEKNLNLPAPD